MNLSPVTASSAPPPTDALRSGEPAHAGEFSNILSQQQGQVREQGAATTHVTPKSTQASTEEREVPVPDETLALLAAGATLPLMMARTEPASEPGLTSTRGTRSAGAPHAVATTSSGTATDAARAILADAQALASTAAGQLGDAAGMIPATDRVAPQTLNRTVEPIALTPSDTRGAQAASTRPHTALAPATGAGQLAARTSSAKPDAAQTAFTQIASAIGLNTQPVTIAATPAIDSRTPAIDSRSIQDAANAMIGAAQAQGTGATILTAQSSSPVVATPLSNPAWAADFSRQFVSITQGRDMSQPHTIELRLDPPSLGPVRITLHISDSIAQTAFVSPHAVVRQAIENALPQLQQQLADAGLSLGQASVNDQQAGQQGFEQSSSQGSRTQSVFSLDGSTTSNTSALPSAPRQAPRSPNALVDTFA